MEITLTPEKKAEIVSAYFKNLDKSFDYVVGLIDGVSYYLCDKVIQEYIKNNVPPEFEIIESKINQLSD